MNIFAVHVDPARAAEMLCDRHVVKMALETAQLLSTVHHQYGASARYKPTHAHHPCTVWSGQSKQNYDWLVQHGLALCHEYTHRYGKRHACESVIEELRSHALAIPDLGRTAFAQAMPDEYRHADAVTAYRRYYSGAKRNIARWSRREPPAWFEYSDPTLDF